MDCYCWQFYTHTLFSCVHLSQLLELCKKLEVEVSHLRKFHSWWLYYLKLVFYLTDIISDIYSTMICCTSESIKITWEILKMSSSFRIHECSMLAKAFIINISFYLKFCCNSWSLAAYVSHFVHQHKGQSFML